jgi:predicted RNA-binding Zn-ribbon protein involved in translation (DUF1610 family)
MALLIGAIIAKMIKDARNASAQVEKYCPDCGIVGAPRFTKRGSAGVEILLWFLMIVPGIVYSIWRSSTERQACPSCGQSGLIPLDSPKAQAALGEHGRYNRWLPKETK